MVVNVVRGQELARGIVHFLKHQLNYVPEKCPEIQFSTSSIFPSMSGIVNGLNMDELFGTKQAVPTTTTSTFGNGANLASITTLMLTTMSSKNATNHADSDKEETIDYNSIPTDVRDHCALKNYPDKIIDKGYLVDNNNKLTFDFHGTRQDWRTVEYPKLGNGNTTKHAEQRYIIMNDSTLYGHL